MARNNEKITEYANAIYQNAMVGKQSCSDLLNKIENEELKQEVDSEYYKFDEICDALELFAKSNKIDIKDNNFFEKARMWMSINMGTMFNNTTRHIVQLLMVGSVMGLSTIYKDKFDHQNVNADLDRIIEDLEHTLENNYNTLKDFLKKYNYAD